jgi:hypothetical protein
MNLKELSRERAARVRRLRENQAPRWVIKAEQVAMVLNRRGLKTGKIGAFSKAQQALYDRHVIPLLGVEEIEKDD